MLEDRCLIFFKPLCFVGARKFDGKCRFSLVEGRTCLFGCGNGRVSFHSIVVRLASCYSNYDEAGSFALQLTVE